LEGHLQGDFDCGGPIVRKEDVVQPARRDFDEAASQLDGRWMRRAEQRDVGDLVELVTNGRVDGRMAMTMNVAPQAADAVEVLATIDVNQGAAVSPLNEEGLVLRHLSKRVPDVVAVPAFQVVE
jgi:hypothetical protein